VIAPIERRRVGREGHGGILPAHIIHEEEEDIGALRGMGLGSAEERSGEQEATPETEEKGRAHSVMSVVCAV